MRKSKETSNKPQNTTYTIQEMKEAHIAKYQNQSKKKKKNTQNLPLSNQKTHTQMRKSRGTSNKPQNTPYRIQEMKEAQIAKYQN